MRIGLKRTAIWVSAILLGLIVLLWAAGFYLHSSAGQRLLMNRIDAAIPGTILWKKLVVAPAEGRLSVEGLQMRTPDGLTVGSIDRVDVNLDWLPLLKGELRIPILHIDSPEVQLAEHPDGMLNIARVFVSPEPSEAPKPDEPPVAWPASVRIDDLRLSRGHLTLDIPGGRWRFELDRLDVAASGSRSGPQADLRLHLGDLRVEGPSLSAQLLAADLNAALLENRLEDVLFAMESGKSRLLLKGSVRDVFTEPDFDLVLESAIDLEEVRESLRVEPILSGMIQGKIRMTDSIHRPGLSANLSYEGGDIQGFHLDGADLALGMKNQQVRIERLEARSGGGSVTIDGRVNLDPAFPDGLWSSNADPDRIAYDINLDHRNLDLGILAGDPPRIGGILNGTARLTGSGLGMASLDIRGRVNTEARSLVLPALTAPVSGRLSLQGSAAGPRIDIEQFDVDAEGVQGRATGVYDLSDRSVDAEARVDARSLGRILGAVGLPDADGSLEARFKVAGRINRPAAEIDLISREVTVDGFGIGNLDVIARFLDGRLDISKISLRNGEGVLNGSGSLSLLDAGGGFHTDGPIALTLTAGQLNPLDFWKAGPLQGSVSGRIELSGSLARPEAGGELEARAIEVSGREAGTAKGAFRFSEGRLTAETLDWTLGRSSLRLSGEAALLDPASYEVIADPAFELALKDGRIHLEDVTGLASGALTLRGDFHGTFSHPKGNLFIRGKQLVIDRQPLAAAFLDARLENDRLVVEPLKIEVAAGEGLTGRGWIEKTGVFEASVETEGIRIENLHHLADVAPFSGSLRASATGSGPIDAPRIQGNLQIRDFRYGEKPLDEVRLRLTSDARSVSIAGTAGFDIEANADWERKQYNVRVAFAQTPLEPYFALAGRPELDGRLTGSLDASGQWDDWIRSEADLEIDTLRIDRDGSRLLETRRLTARLEAGNLRIPEASFRLLDEAEFKLRGSGRLDGPIAFTAEGEIPLRIASQWTDALPDLSGRVAVSAEVGGAFADPAGAAELRLIDASFTVPELLQRVRGLNGTVRLAPGGIEVERVRGRLDDGAFQLDGFVPLEDFKPGALDFTLKADALPVSVPDTVDLRLDSTLSLSGPLEALQLSGRITVIEALYYRDFKVELVDTLERLRRPEPSGPPVELPESVARTALNIDVAARSPFMVDNNVALISAVPNLRITGTVDRPMISGRADIQAGTIRYNKREFTVTRGVIDFVNPYRIEPLIDLAAESRIREWTIVLDVTGPPDNLRFQLTSRPSESDEDILSLLAFGKTSRELASGEGRSAGAMPRELLASLVADRLAEDLKEAVGIDSIEVEYEAGDTTADDDIRVTVGKELSRRLSVRYGLDTKKGETVQRVTTDYRLLERLVLSAFQDTAGDFGGELQFRLEFR
ncbi:MAG: translocation/assembly module TamB domain-containing protein [Desulfobacterales bacterium]